MKPTTRFDLSFLHQLEALQLATRRCFVGQTAGERRSPRHGAGLEFVDFRPYAHGDEPHQVDWNIYARTDRLIVKLFSEERDLCLHLLVDTSASMAFGEAPKIDCALRSAAALGYIALARHERLALSLLNERPQIGFAPRKGRRQLFPLLKQLNTVQCSGRASLGTSLVRYAAQCRTPGVAVIISDLLDPPNEYRAGIGALLARGFDVQVLHVLADEELDPPLEGDLQLIDQETGTPIDNGDITFAARGRAAYSKNLQQHCDEAARFCLHRSLAYLCVRSSTPLETPLLRRLRERHFLR